MTAESLINVSIPFLKLSDNVRTANLLFNLHKLTWLPVIDETSYLGMLSDSQLLDEGATKKISSFKLVRTESFGRNTQHFLDILRLLGLHEINLMPILNQQNEYVGCVTTTDIGNYISGLSFINSIGGILVLAVGQNQYSLSEISRIVESNDLKVLSLYISDNPDNSYEAYVTLKLNKIDLTRLIASFERFSYKIVAEFHESAFQSYETERLELLFKYLNI